MVPQPLCFGRYHGLRVQPLRKRERRQNYLSLEAPKRGAKAAPEGLPEPNGRAKHVQDLSCLNINTSKHV